MVESSQSIFIVIFINIIHVSYVEMKLQSLWSNSRYSEEYNYEYEKYLKLRI